ncbi:MAG: sugar phosphate isomerase/epimerase [Candidatus Omnitrophica bacterium]|nr:sugar phosphate isomerase/epimerase [Candidatus Omnitrophota bacterium]
MQKNIYNSVALSTSWNVETQPGARQMLAEIKANGFDRIELSHHLSSERLEELIVSLDIFDIKVVSVHNFCPLPSKPRLDRSTSDYYRLSSLKEDECRNAVEYTKRTIDTAKRLSAEVVVLHAGTVELEKEYGWEMTGLYAAGKRDSREFRDLKREFLIERADKKLPHLEAAEKSLKEILDYAFNTRVKIGLETRCYPEEIPNFDEIAYFLNLFGDHGLYYWHDTGHGEVSERLGMASHVEFLKAYSNRMIGIHIHDVRGITDHLVPFTGDLDFSKIAPYIPDDVIKVIEVNSQATSSEIKQVSDKFDLKLLTA